QLPEMGLRDSPLPEPFELHAGLYLIETSVEARADLVGWDDHAQLALQSVGACFGDLHCTSTFELVGRLAWVRYATSRHLLGSDVWCGRRDLNPHGFWPREPKSRVSTNSTTPASAPWGCTRDPCRRRRLGRGSRRRWRRYGQSQPSHRETADIYPAG